MKTINDLFKAIQNPEFKWKHSLKYAILQCGTHKIVATGDIDPEEPWLLPDYISGTFDINIRGVGYKPIRFENFNINIQGRTTINLPLIVQEDRFYPKENDNKLVQCSIRAEYMSEPFILYHDPADAIEIPDHIIGEVEIVWRNENNKIILKRKDHISNKIYKYHIRLPIEVYEKEKMSEAGL